MESESVATLIPQAAATAIASMIERDPGFRDRLISDPGAAMADLGINADLAVSLVSAMFGVEFEDDEENDVGGYGCMPPFPSCACTKPDFNKSTSKVQSCISSGSSTKVVKR
jgi:hypothetical protein